MRTLTALLLVSPFLQLSTGYSQTPPVFTEAPQQVEYFESSIRPILVQQCGVCHGDQVQMAGLKLITAEGFFKGSQNGPIVDSHEPDASRLLLVVGYEGKIKMPPTAKLAAEQIEAFKTWIRMGAPWPKSQPTAASSAEKAEPAPADNKLWAFQPMSDPAPPAISDTAWVETPIDAFLLAKLQAAGLKPAVRADKLTLLRRAKFDLHGLPPTDDEIAEFLADQAPGAFARLVDRLLASPRYGEKWGRHWLDVARYADSTGLDEDLRLTDSWRYRDYVIDAFNNDLPYDRFVTEQLAGDLLPAAKPEEINLRGVVATGFLALGPKPLAQQDKMRVKYDVVDEQIDTVSKAFMGLTVACARCHDHKFDPISTKDYYSMASIFASTKDFEDIAPLVSKIYFAPLVPREQYDRYEASQNQIKTRELQIEALIQAEVTAHETREWRPRIADYMLAARSVYESKTDPGLAAREHNLAEQVLSKWVAYLKPGGEFRPYLQMWHEASSAQASTAASKYQAIYLETASRWEEQWTNWKEKLDRVSGAGAKPPEKPALDDSGLNRPTDRFFVELHAKESPFFLPEQQREEVLSPDVRRQVTLLRQEIEKLGTKAPPAPPMACAVAEGEPVEQHVFLAGDHKNPGDPVAKQFPVILAGSGQPPITAGSGRLELGRWLTRPDHPLTARVLVNRVWQWHFGEGLVRTPNNFGSAGERPTHPELLDYLAREFVRRSWSLKSLHRLIMNSSAYQMSSEATEDVLRKDPDNRLWSHFHRRRLTIEEIRDSFLALSQTLDLTMGGRISDGLKADEYEKRPSFDPDKIPRRTVYLPLVRNKLPSLLRLFDFVDSATSAGERTESNVAPQALFMMNSKFIHQQSRSLATLLLAAPDLDDAARLRRAYRWVLTRDPGEDAAVEPHLDYIRSFPKGPPDDPEAALAAWASFCRVLMVSNEFHYVE